MSPKGFIGVAALAFASGLGSSAALASITIPTVPIGNPGNAADPTTGFGSVAYTYNIGQTEVTNAQYAAFLNAKAKSDPFGLYNTSMGTAQSPVRGGITRVGTPGSFVYTPISGRENHPVNWVSFWDACRFANWLHNGQGSGDTETGAYTLTPEGISSNSITRNAGWQWAVTSENEWYKAAYHQPASQGGPQSGYWLYPTSSNTVPDTSQVNFSNAYGGLTPVGSFAPNFYGTLDMAGNVWEWNESVIFGSNRVIRGGSFNQQDGGSGLRSPDRNNDALPTGSNSVGFRVVAIPTPTASAFLMLGALVAACRRRRR